MNSLSRVRELLAAVKSSLLTAVKINLDPSFFVRKEESPSLLEYPALLRYLSMEIM